MRLGVLDVGSNTVHLLVVDAHPGAHPWPAHSEKSLLRLAEQIGPDGALTPAGADALVEAVAAARAAAEHWQTSDLIAFATSAVRDATNSAAVLARVRAETGVHLQVLSGADEARMTFLAVRRWFGWSAGRLLVLDIGGGSLELAAGVDEEPHLAQSLPLGAGRLTRERLGVTPFTVSPPAAQFVADLREYVDAQVQTMVPLLQAQGWDRTVGTSKTFRTLARLTGAAPSSAGLWAPRRLTRTGLRQVTGFIRHIPPAELHELEGVSASRGHQLLAGAVVAESVMRQLGIESLDICPWALREGVILRRMAQLELISAGDLGAVTGPAGPRRPG
ncbi:Ppx/GppA phosphatase family protein [Solwaraspora sp. WMMD792]|uniref:Ppx/GppA phosphatase family protein n=1 Tax=Solwaraspora sp. WMMD792 TaxID=3016099 RepID=UPI002417EB20|nr:Ppx/GppA phosphatase family protein [Solwaraspora sp. WMMD792]MDG4773172.1 Ppx/GppA phosphatase family protein [Solwaraspora sp. WMMD792]